MSTVRIGLSGDRDEAVKAQYCGFWSLSTKPNVSAAGRLYRPECRALPGCAHPLVTAFVDAARAAATR